MAWPKLVLVLAVFMAGCSGAREQSRPQSELGLQYPHFKSGDVWIAPSFDVKALDGGPLDVMPKMLDSEAPQYPPLPLAAGIEGIVALEVIVGLNGEVKHSRVIKSTVSPVMEKSALQASQKFRFRPGKRGDEPIECKLKMRIFFTLR